MHGERRTRRQVVRSLARVAAIGASSAVATTGGCLDRTRSPDEGDRDLAVTGAVAEGYDPVDQAVRQYVRDRSITAAAVRLVHEGTDALHRGYGWRDDETTEPVRPNDLFRIASVTKPITAAAVRTLASRGDFSLDDSVVSLVGVDPPPNADSRLSEVTVRHLLAHRGGWDSRTTFDPMADTRRIAGSLGLDRSPRTREIVRYVFGRPLQFDPGAYTAYSNFGYALLGIVIEDVTGDPFVPAVRRLVLDPRGIDDVRPAESRLDDRHEREVHYRSGRRCPSALEVESPEWVECADGSYDLEAGRASGGLVASTTAVVRFAAAYRLDGRPTGSASVVGEGQTVDGGSDGGYRSPPRDWWESPDAGGHVAYGALPGTFAVAYRPAGRTRAAALFNYLPQRPEEFTSTLREALITAEDS